MASQGPKSDLLRRCETCEDTAELAQLVEEVENELMVKFKFKELEDACFALFVKPAILQEDLANVYLFLATTCDDSRYDDREFWWDRCGEVLGRLEEHAAEHGTELSNRYEQVRNSLENMQRAVEKRLLDTAVSDSDEDSASDHSDDFASSTTQSAAATMELDTAISAATLGSTATGSHGTADDHTPVSHITSGTANMTKTDNGTYNDGVTRVTSSGVHASDLPVITTHAASSADIGIPLTIADPDQATKDRHLSADSTKISVTSPAASPAAHTTISPVLAPTAAALTDAVTTTAHSGANAMSDKEQHLSFPSAASTLESLHVKVPTQLAFSLTQTASSPTVTPRVKARSEDSAAVAVRGADAVNDNELPAVRSVSAHGRDIEDTEGPDPTSVPAPANHEDTSSLITASGADVPMSTGVVPARDNQDAGVATQMAIRPGHVHGDIATSTAEYTDGHGHVHHRDVTQTDEDRKATGESEQEQKRLKTHRNLPPSLRRSRSNAAFEAKGRSRHLGKGKPEKRGSLFDMFKLRESEQ
ncbi:hypothetical protein B0A48_05763 [Cryoendolithus antarcticus]|uniref:Uncharacterized protein n=1 Tax=Cryoendolithus antarcticus TaxID=1507870 RepID=A0A1V8TBW2_9PEZI|nr:hypothetical protein B0A48_05763 [Cryoendolithus antarcticus]